MQETVKIVLFSINYFVRLCLAIKNFLANSNDGMSIRKPEQSIIESVPASEIQPGDILSISGNTLVDKIVKLVTRSPYSHVIGMVNSNQVVEFFLGQQQGSKKYRILLDLLTCSLVNDYPTMTEERLLAM